jgi:cell division protease FtsH
MITRYGMDKTLGQRTYALPRPAFLGQGPVERNEMGEATAREIDIAVRDLMGDAFAQAVDLLKSRQAELDQGAALLLERETLTVDEFPPLRSHVAPAAKLQAV